MEIIQQNSPYLRRKASLKGMLLDVLIALLPVVIFALIKFTWHTLVNLAISIAIMAAAEYVFVLIKNWGPRDGEKHSLWERIKFASGGFTINNFLAPTVSAVIYTMLFPAQNTNPIGFLYFALAVGALFGVVFGKLVFGGTGQNIFNPAVVGFIFVKLCFSSSFSGAWYVDSFNAFPAGGTIPSGGSVIAGGTILSTATNFETVFSSPYSFLDMFLGNIPGTMGETCKLAILIGLVYLLIRQEIDWRVVVSFLGTFLTLILIAGLVPLLKGLNGFDYGTFILTQLLSGGLLFGATFMLTDPVTMPITTPSRWLYGVIAAVSTVFIRLLGGYPEGVAFSILIANMVAPVLDHYKWSSSRFNLKNVLPLVIVPLCAVGILLWVLIDKLPDGNALTALFGGAIL